MKDARRYDVEQLLYLRDSPLCVKPKDLPPKEEYMGVPASGDTTRPTPKTTTDRPFGSFPPQKADPGSRRAVVDRHGSRNGASDGLVLGPPRTNFSSRTTFGDTERNDKTPGDAEFRERLQRGKMGAFGGDADARGARSTNFRAREDGEREGEGWNMTKPRKNSFGQEGAERFTGRMGGDHRQRDDRGKEREEHGAVKDRRRPFDNDVEEGDAPRRNGLARGKTDPWFKESTAKAAVDPAERAMNRERIEKAKSWRTHDPEEKSADQRADRGDRGDRHSERHDRRWDRDRAPRQEREPEWVGGEPAEEKNAGHTEHDFNEFMRERRGGTKAADKAADASAGPPGLPDFFTADAPAVQSAPAEPRPDKFFAKFSETAATALGDDKSEVRNVPAMSSKFASLFQTQPAPAPAAETLGYRGGYTEPSTPAAGPTNGAGSANPPQSDNQEKEAFQALLSKLTRSTKPQGTPTPPNVNAFSQPPPSQPPATQSPNVSNDPIRKLAHVFDQKANLGSPEPPLPYDMGRPEPRLRSVPPPRPEIMAPRPMQPPSQPPTVRHDQILHELVAQRHSTQSQGSGRAGAAVDQHQAFLMQLMQQQNIPEQQRPIEPPMRLPQQNQRQPSLHFEPEPVFMREHGPPQQRPMQPPAGFESQFRRSEGDGRMMQQQQQQQQQQPPHPFILQRQPMMPPGLDHGLPLQQQMWPGQQLPPGQRQGPMIPQPQMQPSGRAPPGLPFGGPAMGNGQLMNGLPPNMLQSNDNMSGMPRGMPPPGFFGGGPPPGGPGSFMPPPGMGGGPFPGPDSFFQPGPYDGRGGMPPPGGAPFRR